MAKTVIFALLTVMAVIFSAAWYRYGRRERDSGSGRVAPSVVETAIGFVTNFFDTLGIGSFATTTAIYKLHHLVDDRLIPGTLNAGHTLPVIVQAFIYIAIVQVDVTTLILLTVAAVAGAWLGAGIVSGWPRRNVQIGMGSALFAAAGLMLMTQLDLFPGAGTATGLTGVRLLLGVAGNFMLGALMSLGIGLYAPCMIMISLLGMNPTMAFPIMMGSCAFLMPVGSMRFIQKGGYSLPAALGLAIGGIPAVLIAAYLVTSLPLGAVRWLVIVVVVYTATMMLRSAFRESAVDKAVVDARRAATGH